MVRFVLGVCVVELALRLSSYARRSGRLLRWTVIPIGDLLPLFGIGALLPEWLLERVFRRKVRRQRPVRLSSSKCERRLRETTRQFTIVMGQSLDMLPKYLKVLRPSNHARRQIEILVSATGLQPGSFARHGSEQEEASWGRCS